MKRKYSQNRIEDKIEHAIKLAELKKRMATIGMTRYANEFPQFYASHLRNVMGGKILNFDFLEALEEKIKTIEKLLSTKSDS